eukprot:CAMPEP_0194340490 /NCGR_PEP_ID=MMETSP0171-20130528/86566_1 /TAXON_ID=218684 /ORGANISM="Corethron pennatum, Strain L29A3" /LENGTH=395 /DNA_ID=CAMNT_0039105463 /DNA_START=44 /DNA_END=1227 /DNA_ORIENTATION=+
MAAVPSNNSEDFGKATADFFSKLPVPPRLEYDLENDRVDVEDSVAPFSLSVLNVHEISDGRPDTQARPERHRSVGGTGPESLAYIHGRAVTHMVRSLRSGRVRPLCGTRSPARPSSFASESSDPKNAASPVSGGGSAASLRLERLEAERDSLRKDLAGLIRRTSVLKSRLRSARKPDSPTDNASPSARCRSADTDSAMEEKASGGSTVFSDLRDEIEYLRDSGERPWLHIYDGGHAARSAKKILEGPSKGRKRDRSEDPTAATAASMGERRRIRRIAGAHRLLGVSSAPLPDADAGDPPAIGARIDVALRGKFVGQYTVFFGPTPPLDKGGGKRRPHPALRLVRHSLPPGVPVADIVADHFGPGGVLLLDGGGRAMMVLRECVWDIYDAAHAQAA